MEDKRISRSKQALKHALVELLKQVSFEELTVIQLCNQARLSRITFYAHYTDKYGLATELIQDYIQQADQIFTQMHPCKDAFLTSQERSALLHDMLDCIFHMYHYHIEFFRYATPTHSAYLYAEVVQQLIQYVTRHILQLQPQVNFRYPATMCIQFVIYGLWGFFMEAVQRKNPAEDTIHQAHDILQHMLESKILLLDSEETPADESHPLDCLTTPAQI